jgi:threonine/homoserine/homoserine lactone efflux protein
MVPARDLVEFAALASVLVAVPGPSVLFTVTRALTEGRRTALLNVLGNSAGLMAQVGAVAFGVGALVSSSARLFDAIKLFGAAYLIYLGVQAVRHRGALAEALSGDRRPVSAWRALQDGFVVGAMNPKTIAFLVAALPQFTVRGDGSTELQMLVLGALFPLIALCLDSVWALGASAAREWLFKSPRRLSMVGGTGGLMMIGLGIGLAATRRRA